MGAGGCHHFERIAGHQREFGSATADREGCSSSVDHPGTDDFVDLLASGGLKLQSVTRHEVFEEPEVGVPVPAQDGGTRTAGGGAGQQVPGAEGEGAAGSPCEDGLVLTQSGDARPR